MLNIKKALAALAALSLLSFAAYAQAYASQNPVKFSIGAVESDKQLDKSASYFDLMLSPGEEHVLEVDIFNSADTPIDVSVSANTAGTNSGGVIEYDNPQIVDDSLKAAFGDAASVETPLINIPGGSFERARINVKMPDEPFDGVMLGGIVVKKINDEAENVTQGVNGTTIQNEYCYVLGVKIRVNSTEVAPDFRLIDVEPSLLNSHTSIAARLQNFKAAIANNVKINAEIYFNNDAKPLYSATSDDFDIAPNSTFDFFIPAQGRLSPGSYRLVMTIEHNEKLWEFDEMFSVTNAVVNNVNSQAVNVPRVNYYRMAAVFFVALLFIAALFVVVRAVIGRRREAGR